ncbi:hypothetical protein GCM10011578_049260 [Streptomyces fuscichromogenes]|uniref:Uncharacterized protein n=1 Tax=Streptomyces fuscichromogenes TaxID=1324013 RepID=A0A917XFA1_9ACTN|nr:hypothetical protein GCM10011578_049260 [Streptomyces fuscichromogenes]
MVEQEEGVGHAHARAGDGKHPADAEALGGRLVHTGLEVGDRAVRGDAVQVRNPGQDQQVRSGYRGHGNLL